MVGISKQFWQEKRILTRYFLKIAKNIIFINLAFMFVSPFPAYAKPAELKNDDQSGGLGLADGCPVEYYHDVRPLLEGEKSLNYFSIGQEQEWKCHSDNKTYQERMLNYPGEFIVYPTSKRTCQANGTWSNNNVPPECIWNPYDPGALAPFERKYTPPSMVLCSQAHRDQAANWRRIGRLHPSCPGKTGNHINDYERFEFYVEFPRRVYLSYMTFKLADENGPITRPFNIEIIIPPENVIPQLSEEATEYLQNHYNSHTREASDECAVMEMAAYTRRLIVRFSVEKTKTVYTEAIFKRWKPSPKFYPIQELHAEMKRAWFGRACPKPPAIPNGFIQHHHQQGPKNDTFVLTYACNSGYVMIDPKTMQPSNGTVSCLEKFEWSPFPLPICTLNAYHQSTDQKEHRASNDRSYLRDQPSPATNTKSPAMTESTSEQLVQEKSQNSPPPVISVRHGSAIARRSGSKINDQANDSLQESETPVTHESAIEINGPKNDSTLYIAMAVLFFLLGFSLVVIGVLIFNKRNKFFARKDKKGSLSRPRLPLPKIPTLFQGSLNEKNNNFIPSIYTAVPGKDLFDSSNSEHAYEEIK